MFSLHARLTHRGHGSDRTSSRRANRSLSPRLDSLEGRQLLTGSIYWIAQGDTISVYGTRGNDSMAMDQEGQFTPETSDDFVVIRLWTTGTSGTKELRLPTTSVKAVQVSLNNGDDRFMNNTSIPTTIYGGEGNDVLWGGGGKDVIYGGAGDDHLRGLKGDDSLFGEAGKDRLEGDEGCDLLDGGKDGKRDVLVGGRGWGDKFIEHSDRSNKGLTYIGVEPEEIVDFLASEGDSKEVAG